MPTPTLFFSAGEPSGDVHGANLIAALKQRHPRLKAVGYGGPKMRQAGCELHADMTALAVMWLSRALSNIHKFWRLYRRARRFFAQQRPDAVVLIDFPGFNWWIAAAAKRQGIPVFYYAPPQVWAWARWRVKKMRRYVDLVLCSLPFEQQWYADRGCNAVLVGHPFFDEVTEHALNRAFVRQCREDDGPLVTILPGSRSQELTCNLRWLLKAAVAVREAVPDARFAVAAFKPAHGAWAQREAAAAGLSAEVHVGRTPELIHAADCCMAVSGSVSLELLYHTKPTVVLYWIGRLPYFLQRFFRKVKYITLVNLLSAEDAFAADTSPYDPAQPNADTVLFPEYLACDDKSRQLAAHVIEWLTDSTRRDARVSQLAALKSRVCHPGAADNAAGHILGALGVPAASRDAA